MAAGSHEIGPGRKKERAAAPDDVVPARRPVSCPNSPSQGGGPVRSLARAARALDLDVALLVHVELLLAHGLGDMLGFLDLALADGDLLLDHGLLADGDLLLLHWDDDLFLGHVTPRRAARGGTPLDHDFLALDRYVDGLVLGDDALAHPHLAGLDRGLVDLEALLAELDRAVVGVSHRVASMAPGHP